MKEKRQYACKNAKCKKTFDTAKKVTYLACPFCETKIEDEKQSHEKCFHHLGYLGERQEGKIIPGECIECMKSIECMLVKTNSKKAAHEIQNWYEQMDPNQHT